jgi:hypothetical protein
MSIRFGLGRPLSLPVLFAAAIVRGQSADTGGAAEPIQDNSFLVEEAYNQEPGVVQHIQTWTRGNQSHDWVYTFTQEWPVPGITHQLSYTIPIQRAMGERGGAAIGDVALNYRYQLAGDGKATIACAPRLSLLLPTGDEKRGYGAGSTGLQLNVPLSIAWSGALVSHSNAGVTYVPSARDAAGNRADTTSWNLGQSIVWLCRPRLNVLLEATWTRLEAVDGPARKSAETLIVVSPGLRWAYNFASGLQIVSGVALPIALRPERGRTSILVYLSFEHPMWRAEKN